MQKAPVSRPGPSLVDVVAAYSNLTHPYKSRIQLQRLLEAARAGTRKPGPQSEVRALRRRLGDETVAKIIADYKAGKPTTQLMADHGISKTGVLKLLAAADVSMRRQPLAREQVSEAAELYLSGLSLAKVSTQMALPLESIRRTLIEAGVQMRPRGAGKKLTPRVPPPDETGCRLANCQLLDRTHARS